MEAWRAPAVGISGGNEEEVQMRRHSRFQTLLGGVALERGTERRADRGRDDRAHHVCGASERERQRHR
jgi:hypothetical protein